MRSSLFQQCCTMFLLSVAGTVAAADSYLEVRYPASTLPGELQLGVTYTLWIPEGAARLRGIIVHQHGCGSGACKGGETAAYDLHWQALAKKWDCALLAPSYHQDDKQNCRLWCDPRNGSAKTYLRAISEFAQKSKHSELQKVPWCLWGHSGGGFWASLMQTLYSERIVAIWLRSGTAYAVWEKGEIPKPEIPEVAYAVPVMCNPGVKENGDKRFRGAWDGTLAMFKTYRAKGAPIGVAPDPRTAHECGDCRYLALPFFDACLAMRLPEKGVADQKLKPVDMKAAWLAGLLTDKPEPIASYAAKAEEAIWLPNGQVAKAWAEYVKTGAVQDTTPPPAASHVQAVRKPDRSVELTWQAEADFESGIRAFIIHRDGVDLAQVPEKPMGRFGRPLFQAMSYHDTPERPLPEMRYVDRSPTPRAKHEYRVIVVNGVGLKSSPSSPVAVPAEESANTRPSAGRPHVLVIHADQVRFDCLGAYGNDDHRSLRGLGLVDANDLEDQAGEFRKEAGHPVGIIPLRPDGRRPRDPVAPAGNPHRSDIYLRVVPLLMGFAETTCHLAPSSSWAGEDADPSPLQL